MESQIQYLMIYHDLSVTSVYFVNTTDTKVVFVGVCMDLKPTGTRMLAKTYGMLCPWEHTFVYQWRSRHATMAVSPSVSDVLVVASTGFIKMLLY